MERYINLTALQLKVGIFGFSVYVLLPLKIIKSISSVEYDFEHYRIENYAMTVPTIPLNIIGSNITAMTGTNIYLDATDLIEYEELTL